MTEWFTNIEPWHWLTFGFVLMILEMLAPSTLFLWMGVSAIVVSLLHWIMPDMFWQVQFILFGILSIVAFFGWRYIAAKKGLDKEDVPNTLNRRSASLKGRRAVLGEPIVNGVGRVQLDDTYWRVEGDDLPEGTHVEVVDVNGATLRVRSLA
ncbi:MAG: NfeD family protein [Kangiellaceae bacterium]|jgi:membrane protein implicated in regulation of membrane protease activity|nr:NfeD family protein [Kangiellaceae bacterium]